MQQHPLTILGRLDTGIAGKRTRLCELSAALDQKGGGIGALIDQGVVHFLSFFVIDRARGPSGRQCPAYVVLEINCDGGARAMRELLVEKAPGFLDALFRGCDGYGESRAERLRFLARNDAGADAFYLAFPGRSVNQIRREDALLKQVRARASALLGAAWPGSASAAWREIQNASKDDPLLRAGAKQPFFVRWTPRRGGLRERAGLWARWCGFASFAAAALTGLYGFARVWGAGALAMLSLVVLGLAALPVSFAYLRDAPKALNWRGRAFVLRSALASWLWLAAALAALCGVIALAQTLPQWAPDVSAWLAAALALGLPVLGIAAFVLLAAAFLYVALGAPVAVAGAILLCAGGLLLVLRFAHAPRELALWAVFGAAIFVLLALESVLIWLYALRKAEANDPESVLGWDIEHLNQVQAREDWSERTHQNHLATVSSLKPGALRLYTLRAVLRAVSLLARIYFTRGDLGGIRTIHHARFLILPDRCQLLFLGNYDLAFSSYLQEFNSVPGVTAVWSNTVGFPRTVLLVGEGARDEQRFKAFARRCQTPTLGWYSAYPDLAIADIEAAAATRADLRRSIDDRTTFLGRMRARLGRPLSEADCDAALRRL